MTREIWLQTHPYLRPVAELVADVERAAAGIGAPSARIPDWNAYRADFLAGVSLLSSTNVAIDLEPAELITEQIVARLPPRTMSPGLLRLVSWTATARYLRPVMTAFDAWRDEERWLRPNCPMCASLPAMAQLVGADPGRKRLLACGCCGTRWQFARTGCPFCGTNAQRLASLTVDTEPGLRIDYCESCRGYLKTYDGEGNEVLWISDWSTFHLDLIAHNHDLKKLAASLYDFGPTIVGR
jgi:FdhE protein